MNIRQRAQDDVFFNFNVAQIGVTVTGCLVLFFFMREASPGLRYETWDLFNRSLVAAVFLGAISLLYNRRYLAGLHALSRSRQSAGEVSPEQWKLLQQATYRLPFRLLMLTFVLWPAAVAAICTWMKIEGLLNLEDAVRVFICGVLYSPIQALILFYASRRSMRILVRTLHELGHEVSMERRGWFGIREKLIASFVCLATVPLLAGVLITEVQIEQTAVSANLNKACMVLEKVHAEAGMSPDRQAWVQAVSSAMRSGEVSTGSRFQVAAGSGDVMVGELDRAARRVWREGLSKGSDKSGCNPMPVPGERRFVVMRFFSDPGVWISAVINPFPEQAPFWTRYGVALVLAAVVIVLGLMLGLAAADDVCDPLEELNIAAAKAAEGELVQVRGFLADDEMSELTLGFNTLIASIHRELGRSGSLVAKVREVIEGLGGQAQSFHEIGARQREVINEQNSLGSQVSGSANQVTRASGVIREKAHGTQYQMEEVTVSSHEADMLLERVTTIIEKLIEHSEIVWSRMEDLEYNYRRMEEVVKIIEDIATRSEILAMNLSLEVGSTGEVSDRLSVVAMEVQRLSERITEQTEDIKGLFSEIRKRIFEMAQTIEDGKNQASEAPASIKKLADSFKGIEKRAEAATKSMLEIAGMTDDQGSALEQMSIMISEILSVASVIDQLSAGAEQTFNRLNSLAEELRELVARNVGWKMDPETGARKD